MIDPHIRVLPTPQAVADEGARLFIAAAEEAIALSDRFTVTLAGGSTPKAMYALLAAGTLPGKVDWAKVHVFFGDERCVPPDDPQSNFGMAQSTLLGKVPIPGDNIYRIKGEIDPEQAAIEYGQLLKEQFDTGGPDLVFLGMGDDGHTASLFPNTPALKETKHRCVSNYVDRLKSWRVTMTAPFLNRARQIVVMAAGAEKAQRVQEVLEGPSDPQRLPIQLITPSSGKMTWLLDVAAAQMGQ